MLRTAFAEAARRRISLAPARFTHALAQERAESAGPALRSLEPSWVPLYKRISKLSHVRSPGILRAEMDQLLRQRPRLSQDQILAYVRRLSKFRKNEGALEVKPADTIASEVHIIGKEEIVYLIPTIIAKKQLMDWMEARGAKLRLGDHALRLDLLSKVHGIHAAEEYFWSLPDKLKSVKTYASLLNCYGKHGLADKGLELYEKMKARNIVPDKLVYNYLMFLYKKAGHPEKTLSTFEEMRQSGISADRFTYFTLIESYIIMNDLDVAEKILGELQKEAPVHWTLYTMMTNNYIKLELFDKAEVALKKVEEVMDKADLCSWYALLSLHAHCGNPTEVKRIWESLKSTFKKCLNKSYLVMLQALSVIDDFESLQQIFQEWQSNHEYYDMAITNVMIKAYLDKGMIDEAEAIRQSTMAQGHCNEVTVNIFAEFYLNKSDVNTALEILRDAKNMVTAHKWAPSKKLISRFLNYYEESKDVAGVEYFLECLKQLECLDVDSYQAVMWTYVVAGRT